MTSTTEEDALAYDKAVACQFAVFAGCFNFTKNSFLLDSQFATELTCTSNGWSSRVWEEGGILNYDTDEIEYIKHEAGPYETTGTILSSAECGFPRSLVPPHSATGDLSAHRGYANCFVEGLVSICACANQTTGTPDQYKPIMKALCELAVLSGPEATVLFIRGVRSRAKKDCFDIKEDGKLRALPAWNAALVRWLISDMERMVVFHTVTGCTFAEAFENIYGKSHKRSVSDGGEEDTSPVATKVARKQAD